MKAFDEHIADAAAFGCLNLVFEAGMYSLMDDLERILNALRETGVHFEVVGGVAVNAHIYALDRSRTSVTRDIDVLIRRENVERVAKAAEPRGYRARKMMGGYTLVRPGQALAEAVRLLFAGEKSKSTQPLPHPEIRPEEISLIDINIPVAPFDDLLQMKLSSLGPEDLVHIETLDDVGLITSAVEKRLPTLLQERLKEARTIIAGNRPDVEG